MDAEMYVSPDGQSRMRVASPETAIRMRARGWRPESQKAAEPAKADAPKSPKSDKS